MPSLLFIPGSLRAASASKAVAEALVLRAGDTATCETADIGALPHYNADLTDDPAVAEFVAQLEKADGLVFVTPEYNYSIPGVLKNAIDWGSRPAFASAFKDKPCFVVTVSGGATGGVRAQAHLKYVLNGMLARPHIDKEIIVPFANTKITDGRFEDESFNDFAGPQFDAFVAGLG